MTATAPDRGEEMIVDVAVVGGGLAGLATASAIRSANNNNASISRRAR